MRQFADAYKAKRKAQSGKALLKSMIESMDTILAENNTKLFEEVVNSLLYNIAKVFQGIFDSNFSIVSILTDFVQVKWKKMMINLNMLD